jgi:hypothetical protein
MSNPEIAAIFALCAALAAAIGSVIRQRSAQQITDQQVGHLALFGMLVRDIRWWTGGLGDIASYCFLAAALDKGSVMLVTALQVTVLLFALPIYAALAMVITVGDPTAGLERGSPQDWLVVAAVLGPALGLCALGAKIWSDRPAAAVLLAVVSGSSLAVFAVLTKGMVDVTEHGGHLLHAWELYPWIAAGVAGMIFQQSAFRAGSLTSSLPTLTVAKPVVAVALGVTVLKETLETDGAEWLLLIAAAVMVIVATVALARGEAATMSAGAGHDAKVTDEPIAPSEPLSG